MTTVEILFRCGTPPTDAVMMALGSIREVYGIRRFRFDRAAHTLRVEYDATRLSAANVARLIGESGLEIVEELSLIPPPPPVPPPPAPTPA
jgi:hypothetical protein